ncbi:MAG: type II toxin-antitoxin system VapC family toxin [Isosphaeraceae bacterium]
MNYVLDACAMIAYLGGEAGSSVVESILLDPASRCYAHALNLCEVYYHVLRRSDEPTAQQAMQDLFADGVVEQTDMDRPFWEQVGRNKARGKISLADCVCLALAQKLSAQLVTSDHAEFDPLVPLGICPILFIR